MTWTLLLQILILIVVSTIAVAFIVSTYNDSRYL